MVQLKKMQPEMTILEIERTTLADYEVIIDAYKLRQLDSQYLASFNAWQTVLASSTDKRGKPVYKRFSDLFDYHKELEKLNNNKENMSYDKEIFDKLRLINERG